MESDAGTQSETYRHATPESLLHPDKNPKTPEKQIRRTANVSSPLPYNTPVSRNESSCKDGFQDQDAKARYPRLAKELVKWIIGPMPLDVFFDEFLPRWSASDRNMPSPEGAFDNISAGENNEKAIYDLLCFALNDGRCPRFKVRVTSDLPEHGGTGNMRPDICIYGEGAPEELSKDTDGKCRAHFGFVEVFFEVKTYPAKNHQFHDPEVGKDILSHKFIRDDDSKGTIAHNLGQIASYAAEVCARQHRTHCFSISIYGTTARFFRWDRAGVIVSREFDIRKQPEILCRFAWRYSHATDAQRGFDTTVTKATQQEELKFKEVVKQHIEDQLSPADDEMAKLLEKHYEPNAVFKIPVALQQPPEKNSEPNDDSEPSGGIESRPYPWDEAWEKEGTADSNNAHLPPPDTIGGLSTPESEGVMADTTIKVHPRSKCRDYKQDQHFLVSVPTTTPLTVATRGTRGYWAVKLPDTNLGETEYKIAFLKDTWRVDAEGLEKEGEVIVELFENGVKFISDIYCQGDVRAESEGNAGSSRTTAGRRTEQRTLTDKYVSCTWNCYRSKQTTSHRITTHIHYRMASVEVGYPLSSFRGTKELIHGGRCSYLASWAAFVLCKILHRDISPDNIILVKKRSKWRIGFLVDWELSSKADRPGRARNYVRSATWAFMSIASLRGVNVKYKFQDDMESFYYVILYASIVWLPHGKSDNVETWLLKFFDENTEHLETTRGGAMKNSNRFSGDFYELWNFKNDALKRWLEGVWGLQWIARHGDQLDWTPRKLYDQWKSTDEEDLPTDDRIDNIGTKSTRKGKEKKKPEPSNATQVSVRSSRNADPPSSRSLNMTHASSKRTAKETEFEDPDGKRLRSSARSKDEK